MTVKQTDKLWKAYPGSHLHCDVTLSGQNSYRVVMSLIDSDGKPIESIEHYGSGDLNTLKEAALAKLIELIELPA